MKMKKDEQLEQVFDEYFEGNGAPNCDLSAAKRAVADERARRSRRRRNWISALSACASLVLIVTLSVVFSPRFRTADPGDNSAQTPPISGAPSEGEQWAFPCEIHTLSHSSVSYTELSEKYGSMFADFVPFEFADNASCDYTLYKLDDKEIYVCADLRYTSGFTRCDAKIYTDLTDGQYRAKEFADFRTYDDAGGYRCKTEYLNGEYVSQIYWQGNAERYAVISSPNADGAQRMMEYFLR